MAEDYFKALFASEDVGAGWQDWSAVCSIISQEQNEELLKEVTEEEVRRAVFDINPNKWPAQMG